MSRCDGCDGRNGEDDTTKITVAIVAIVAFPSPRLPRPLPKIRRSQAGCQRESVGILSDRGQQGMSRIFWEYLLPTPGFMVCGYHLQAMKSGRLPKKPQSPSESPRYFAAVRMKVP